MNILKAYRKKVIFIISIVIGGGIIYLWNYIREKDNNLENLGFEIIEENISNDEEKNEINIEDGNENRNEKNASEKSNDNMIFIHVAGEVKNPGVIKLEEGSRIEDAINKAGGLTKNADISNVNLVFCLQDGMKITIPNIKDKQNEMIEVVSMESQNTNSIVNNNIKNSKNNKININKATQEELETLTGIGESIARKIILYREKNGQFKSVEDIKNVGGIGESKYEMIKDNISVK